MVLVLAVHHREAAQPLVAHIRQHHLAAVGHIHLAAGRGRYLHLPVFVQLAAVQANPHLGLLCLARGHEDPCQQLLVVRRAHGEEELVTLLPLEVGKHQLLTLLLQRHIAALAPHAHAVVVLRHHQQVYVIVVQEATVAVHLLCLAHIHARQLVLRIVVAHQRLVGAEVAEAAVLQQHHTLAVGTDELLAVVVGQRLAEGFCLEGSILCKGHHASHEQHNGNRYNLFHHIRFYSYFVQIY